MSVVSAGKNIAKHGVKLVRNAAAAATATITGHGRHTSPTPSVVTLSASSTKHERKIAPRQYDRVNSSNDRSAPRSDRSKTSSTITTKTSNSSQQRQPPLLTFIHEPHPKPFNCTTLLPTRKFATDPSHPLYIRTQRRLAAFDPTKLTWRVQVPIAVSKKAAIRKEAEKRVRNAVRAVLREAGYGEDGTVLGEGHVGRALSGALLMIMNKDPMRSLRFGSAEARDEVRSWIEKVVRQQDRGTKGRDYVERSFKPQRNGVGVQESKSLKDGMLKAGLGSGHG